MMISWRWYTFSQMSTDLLYQVLALRQDVFIVEQDCVYQDIDGLDRQAMHLLGFDSEQLLAYARVYYDKTLKKMRFGRLLTAPAARGKAIGKTMMDEILRYLSSHYPHKSVHISAQRYLEAFYQSFGFEVQGAPYDEDGIEHIAMVLKRNA